MTEKDKKISVSELADFDAAEYLETPEDIAAYISATMEDGDAALLAVVLGDIVRARGMTEIAKDAGITREALYKILRAGSSPRFDTMTKVMHALGVELVAQPIARSSNPKPQRKKSINQA